MNSLLVTGARLIDPASGLDMTADIAIEDGRIASIAAASRGSRSRSMAEGVAARSSATPDGAGASFDGRGLLAVPGLFDIHAHAIPGLIPLCVDPDEAGISAGATTVCDAGSAGWANLDEAVELLERRGAASELLLFVHVAPEGERSLPETGYERFDRAAARAAIGRHAGRVVGIKARAVEAAFRGPPLDVFAAAADLAHGLGLPLMLHVGDKTATDAGWLYAETSRILGFLGKGDIITHAYTPFPGGLFREGAPIPGLEAALARGVLLDAAPARSQFSFPVARRAIALGFKPRLAGTDTVAMPTPQPHFYSVAAVLSKFMALGLPLAEVLAMATANAARALGRAGKAGLIAPGSPADLSLLRLERGLLLFHDGAAGHLRPGSSFLRPVATIRAGLVQKVSEAISAHEVGAVAVLTAARGAGRAAKAASRAPAAPTSAGPVERR